MTGRSLSCSFDFSGKEHKLTMRTPFRTLASALLGLAVASVQAAPFAYIPHDTGVTVIDVANPGFTQNIAMQGPFRDVAARPGDTRAYVVATPIRVIDIATQRETLQIEANGAFFMALSRTEPKAVVLEGVSTVRFLDTDSRGTLATVTLGAQPASRAAFAATGTRVYVSAGTFIHVLDAQSYQQLTPINVSTDVRGVAPLAAGTRLYAVLPNQNAVRVFNLADNSVVATIPVGTTPSDIVSDASGARMYVSNRGSNSVSVIDTASNAVIATIPVGAAPEGVDITPDGEAVYVVNSGASSVSFISTGSLSVVGGVAVGANPQARGRFIGGPSRVTSAMPGPLTGLFWNPGESGWGIHLTQRGDTIFAAFFTYGSEGAPRWYTGSNCQLTNLSCPTCFQGAICMSPLTESHGPDILSDIFNPALVSRGTVGQMRLQFRSADAATLSYEVNGVGRNVDVQRQLFGAGLPPGHDYTDLWWNPNESGWGLGITQQGSIMFLTWFVYDRPGNPVWYVASRCEVVATGDGCSGRLYRVSGHPAPHLPSGQFDRARVQVEDVGTIRASFSDGNNGQIDYVLHGVAGRKGITRQLF